MYNKKEAIKKAQEFNRPSLANFYVRRLNQGYLKRYLEKINWMDRN